MYLGDTIEVSVFLGNSKIDVEFRRFIYILYFFGGWGRMLI